MTHSITLNFNTDLDIKVVRSSVPQTETRISFSASTLGFTDIDQKAYLGRVDINAKDESEHTATVDGNPVHGEVTFSATEVTSPDGTTGMLWDVYNFADKVEDDVDLEDVPSAEIPDTIIALLL